MSENIVGNSRFNSKPPYTATMPGSTAQEYLDTTFAQRLDSRVLSQIKTVKIPYYGNGTTNRLENGYSTQLFLLSAVEMGVPPITGAIPVDGSVLAYFVYGNSEGASKRMLSSKYWTRTTDTYNNYSMVVIGENGRYTVQTTSTGGNGIRPAFILPYNTQIDSSNNIVV